jgi:hypothetical protein
LPHRRSPTAVTGAIAMAAAIKRAIRIEAAEIGETTTAGAARTVRPPHATIRRDPQVAQAQDLVRAAIRPDPQVVQAQVPAGATATTIRPVHAAVPARIGRTHPELVAVPERRLIDVLGGVIATTIRPAGAAVPAPIGRTRPEPVADQAHRRTVEHVAIGVMVDVATTTGVTAAAAGTIGVMADAIAATGVTDVVAETAGVTAAAVDAMAGATTGTVGRA